MRTVRIATPAYRGQVYAEHEMGVLLVGQDMASVNSGFRLLAVEHGKDFFITARNVLLHNALQSDADLLLWMDADCAPAYTEPSTLYEFLQEATRTQGILGARAVRKGGGFNVVGDNYGDPRPHAVDRIGLDFTVYNLRWFRGAFARCERECSILQGSGAAGGEVHTCGRAHVAAGGPPAMHFFEWRGGVGEDYRACQWVREHGGDVRLDPRMPTWHDGKVWSGMQSKVVLQ